MPQIGWFEILDIVVLAVLIIGPKDFPIVVKKIGSWIGAAKRYFGEIQNTISEVEDNAKIEIPSEEENSKSNNDKKK